KLIAGNWKMNGLRADGTALARDLVSRAAKSPPTCDLLVCPPATLLAEIGSLLAGSRIALGGQDCHAERRQNHHESDPTVRAKATAGLGAGLIPIVCVGETAAQRDAKQHLSVCGGQIAGSLPEIAGAGQLVVAYEPVWAIGTGRTPTTTDIAEVHAFIRAELKKRVANPDAVRILYGGSVNAKNAAEILGVANVDGALVGGASLDGASFWTIAQAAG